MKYKLNNFNILFYFYSNNLYNVLSHPDYINKVHLDEDKVLRHFFLIF